MHSLGRRNEEIVERGNQNSFCPVYRTLTSLFLLPGLTDVTNPHRRTPSPFLFLVPPLVFCFSLFPYFKSRMGLFMRNEVMRPPASVCHMANEEEDFLTHFSQSVSWICGNQSQSSPIPPRLLFKSSSFSKHDCKLECRGRTTDDVSSLCERQSD